MSGLLYQLRYGRLRFVQAFGFRAADRIYCLIGWHPYRILDVHPVTCHLFETCRCGAKVNDWGMSYEEWNEMVMREMGR